MGAGQSAKSDPNYNYWGPEKGGTPYEGSGSGSSGDGTTSSGHRKVQLDDLEMPVRRDANLAAQAALQQHFMQGGGQQPQAGAPQLPPGVQLAGAPGMPGQQGAAGAAAVMAKPPLTEEILAGSDPAGQKAFSEEGLVGTERQQLQLLAHYAEMCDDFKQFQRITRAEGAARNTSDGAQLLLLSGPPGTGKTRHAITFAKALGLPLLVATPPSAAGQDRSSAAAWAAQVRREVRGRDCALFLDEIDHHINDEGSASALRQFLDGVCQPEGSRVLVVGTTNQLGKLPKDVLHRAEVVHFDKPEALHLKEMWTSHAQHLREAELHDLASASATARITGRDVRHCASLCERRAAISFLSLQGRQGYCHGAALANCPPPLAEDYLRCIISRADE